MSTNSHHLSILLHLWGFWDRSEVLLVLLEVILHIIKSLLSRHNKKTSISVNIRVNNTEINVTTKM